MDRNELAGYLSTLGIDEHPEKFLPMADWHLTEIAKAKRDAYKQACEDCSGAIGKLAIHLLKQSQESEV